MNTGLTNQTPQSGGAMAIATSRQSADSQTQMIAAKHYPRDEEMALARILSACSRKRLAESAVWSFKKGTEVIEGASIRLAEVLAQSWGNMTFGFTVLESDANESQVMAYCWDLETNTQRTMTFPVGHMRVTKSSRYLLTDPREIYETVANAAARRVRSCILALIPGDILDAALEACTATLNQAAGKSLPDRITDMLAQFATMDIDQKMLEARLQTPRAAWTAQQVVAMGKLFVAIRDGFLRQSEIPEFVHPDIVPVSQSQKPVTQAAEATATESHKPKPLSVQEQQKATGEAIVRTLQADPSAAAAAQEIWKAMTDAETADRLEHVCDEYRPTIGGFSKDISGKFTKYKNALLKQFAEAGAGAEAVADV